MKISRFRARFLLVGLIFSGVIPRPLPAADAQPPVITQQPVSLTAARMGVAKFTVVATGTPPLAYRWYRDGRTFEGWTQSTLNLHSLTENDIGTYRVTVSNAAGNVISDGARLTLSGSPAPAAPERPAEAKPPPAPPEAKPQPPPEAKPQPPPPAEATETVPVGQKFQLLATADGSPPFKFQWMKDGAPIRGATNATFAIPRVQPADAGVYTCIVSNSAGSNPSAPLKLVVQKP